MSSRSRTDTKLRIRSELQQLGFPEEEARAASQHKRLSEELLDRQMLQNREPEALLAPTMLPIEPRKLRNRGEPSSLSLVMLRKKGESEHLQLEEAPLQILSQHP